MIRSAPLHKQRPAPARVCRWRLIWYCVPFAKRREVPAAYNALACLTTTKAIIPYGGGIGADPFIDRAGIMCRTVKDTAIVLDALKEPVRGYYDPRDIYTALPKALISKEPYASFADNR